MKTLVIGGNRFFGKRLVSRLVEAGHDVTIANRGSKHGFYSKSVTHLVVDRSSPASMSEVFGDHEFDIVFDQVCYNQKDAALACETFKNKIGRLVFTSTASVYSTAPNRSESYFNPETFDPSNPSESEYQHGKRSAEKIFLTSSFPVVSVRIPVVVGLDDYTLRAKHSPYGIESNSTLSVQKATDLGFDFKAASQWFPKLISEIVAL